MCSLKATVYKIITSRKDSVNTAGNFNTAGCLLKLGHGCCSNEHVGTLERVSVTYRVRPEGIQKKLNANGLHPTNQLNLAVHEEPVTFDSLCLCDA